MTEKIVLTGDLVMMTRGSKSSYPGRIYTRYVRNKQDTKWLDTYKKKHWHLNPLGEEHAKAMHKVFKPKF